MWPTSTELTHDMDDCNGHGEKELKVVQRKEGLEHSREPADTVVEAPKFNVPDGGWGWAVCFACFMTHVLMDGVFYSFGIVFVELLDYYKGSKAETAWIVSLSTSMCFLSGPVVAALTNKFGCRIVACVGTLFTSVGFIASIYAPNIYFLYFSFGIICGFGYGMTYLPSVICVSQYFDKHRAFATGLGVCGSGIGTFIFSPITTYLIESFGWRGAILIQAGLMLNCLACSLIYRPLDQFKTVSRTQKCTVIEDLNCQVPHTGTLDHVTGSGDILNNCSTIKHTERTDRNCHNHVTTDIVHKIDTNNNDFTNEQHLNAHSVKTENDVCSASECNKDSVAFDINSADRNCHTHITTDSVHKNGTNSKSYDDLTKKQHLNTLNVISENDVSEVLKDSVTLSINSTDNKVSFTRNKLLREIYCNFKQSFSISMFKNKAFSLFVISTFFYGFGYYTPYVYLPVRSRDIGLSDSQAAWVLSTVGISNTFGRVGFGFISDKKWVNRLYLYNTSIVICGIGTAFGSVLRSFASLLVYAVVFGMFSGVTVSLTSVLLTDIVGIAKLSDAFGVANFFGGISVLVGPPFAGWLFDISESYDATFVTAGVTIAISGAILYVIPCVDRKWNKDKLVGVFKCKLANP